MNLERLKIKMLGARAPTMPDRNNVAPEKTPDRSAPSLAMRNAPGMSKNTPARLSEDMTMPLC